ncbi:hypothetical protein ACHAWX_005694 [Stephanocyclus meneghinianus]
MGGEPVIIIPTNLLNTNLAGAVTAAACDDISDLASTDGHSFAFHPEHDNDEIDSELEDEDDFPDFPPNFDFQSKAIPPHFLCPLTKSVMLHPVIDAEGNTYERRAILRWLDLEDTSPVTANSLSAADLVENKRRMAAIEAYREEVWSAYNAGTADEALFKKDKRVDYKERNRKMRHDKKQVINGTDITSTKNVTTKKYELLTDKSNKLLMQMQEELDMLQRQHEEESKRHKKWLEELNNDKKQEDAHNAAEQHSHVEYLLHRKREDKPKHIERDRIKSKRRDNYLDDAEDCGAETALVVRKPSSRSPHPEVQTFGRKSQNPKNSLELSHSFTSRTADAKNHHGERRSSRRLLQDPALSSSVKSTSSHRSNKVSPVPPPLTKTDDSLHHASHTQHRNSKSLSCSNVLSVDQGGNSMLPRASSCRNSIGNDAHDTTAKDGNKCSITERIIAEVNGCAEPASLTRAPSISKTSFTGNPTTASTSSESQLLDPKRDHGWSVPIGVHKVICDSPGLLVTCDIHRRSVPVKRVVCAKNDGDNGNNDVRSRRKQPSSDQQLIIPPGTYVEVIETQVHGDRVRGKIVWDEEVAMVGDEPGKATRKRSSFMLGKLTHKKDKVAKNPEPTAKKVTHRYTGWVSLRWSGEKDESKAGKDNKDMRMPRTSPSVSKHTDEDAGPWTEPVALGVYCVSFSHGLPVREFPDRDSTLVGMLERGQYVEVVETRVKGDRVRARCILAPASKGDKSINGWISLFNAVTGSSGATAVPLGAYVAVSEANCTVTEGGSLNSKFRSLLRRGSCVEIVATRIEDGVVRGLISTGGHVTLIGPKQSQGKKNEKSCSSPNEEQYLMHVPTGVYKVIYAKGLPVFMGLETNSPSAMDLDAESLVQVVETSVRNGRVFGRIISVINGNARHDLHGWIYLFESSRRWCKFAFI